LDFGRLGFVPTNICSLKFLRLWNLQLHYCAYKMPTIGPYPKPAEFVHLASAFSKIGFEAVSLRFYNENAGVLSVLFCATRFAHHVIALLTPEFDEYKL
jgi:hypothetical protein